MEKDREKKILLALLAAGTLLRILYAAVMPYNISPHDLGFITDTGEITWGHLGYIGYLLQYHQLPDFDPRTVGAFYNPPFYYIVSALWVKLMTLLGAGFETAVSSLKVLALAYSTASVWLEIKILREFSIHGRTLTLLGAFAVFFPVNIWLSATLSTDGLALMLMLLALLYTVRWYKNPTMKNILVLALAIGLGMMTKLNAGFMALGTAFLFFVQLVRTWRADRRKAASLACQFAVFGLVCVPLGLFWPVRNYLRFGMPLSYIPRATQAQYIGDAGLWARLGLPGLSQLVYPRVHFDTALDTNIWLTMIRTALFDEQNMIALPSVAARAAAVLFLWLSLVLAAGMTVLFAAAVLRRKSPLSGNARTYLALTYAPLMAGYLVFCFTYPSICTMNYRYIAVLTVVPMIGTGVLLPEELRQSRPKLYALFTGAVVLFCTASALLYLQSCVCVFLGAGF